MSFANILDICGEKTNRKSAKHSQFKIKQVKVQKSMVRTGTNK